MTKSPIVPSLYNEKALVWGRNRQRRRFVCAETLHSIENSPHLLVSAVHNFTFFVIDNGTNHDEDDKREKSFPFLRATPNNLKLVFETFFVPILFRWKSSPIQRF